MRFHVLHVQQWKHFVNMFLFEPQVNFLFFSFEAPLPLTPWSRVLEKMIVTQLVKKFTAFYGTRRFITVFTRLHHWSPSWTTLIQSTTSHPVSLRYILIILPSHLCLGLPGGLPLQLSGIYAVSVYSFIGFTSYILILQICLFISLVSISAVFWHINQGSPYIKNHHRYQNAAAQAK